jgi:hypothetical protein
MIGGSPSVRTNSTALSLEVNFDEVISTIRIGQSVDSWINTSANFGIGLATPLAKLHVAGDTLIDGDTTIDGNIIASSLPVYADEAAAIVGGLATDSIYKTATGELRIKL